MNKLPYTATTATGDRFELEFPLHADTGSAVRVEQLVTATLNMIDKDIGIVGETSNGDVLQALAMALAVRARMIHAPHDTVRQLSLELVSSALDAVADAQRRSPPAGHA